MFWRHLDLIKLKNLLCCIIFMLWEEQSNFATRKSKIDPQYPYAFSKYLGEMTVLH